MLNFTYCNPVKIVFGKGAISELSELVPNDARVLLTFGGGSIKKNGVYDQVKNALGSRETIEFGGIEPNPAYETLMEGVELGRREAVTFLLAVGGGSVLDGTKFIAAAIPFKAGDPWNMVVAGAPVPDVVPLGCIMTLPATGSEMNSIAVISRKSVQEKIGLSSPKLFPLFSILEPSVTLSLPAEQVRNGIVDAFVHVVEQYMTVRSGTPLQDRQAEAILLTLIEEGSKTLQNPEDYDKRANLVWCATQALNGLIGCGIRTDFSTHRIGHELTALYGVAHAESLAILLPAVWRYKKDEKKEKLLQYGERIWGITDGSDEERIDQAIARTREFFHSLGMPTRLSDYNIPLEAASIAADRLRKRGWIRLGELQDIGPQDVEAIIRMSDAHPCSSGIGG